MKSPNVRRAVCVVVYSLALVARGVVSASGGPLDDAWVPTDTSIDSAISLPGFTQQPASRTLFVGQTALFRVGLSGTPAPTCQWQISTDFGGTWSNVVNGGAYAGATSTLLRVFPVTLAMSGYQFRCLASNSDGSATSDAATLSVAVVAPGAPTGGGWTGQTLQMQNMSFTVNAGTGQGSLTNLSYGAADGCIQSTVNYPIPVAIANNAFAHSSSGIGVCTTATRTITGTFGNGTSASGLIVHSYPLVPPFGCNCFGTFYTEWQTSTGAALAPQIAVAPADQELIAGQNAQFTAAATGTPLPAYQWEFSTNGGSTFANVPAASPFSGATTPTLTIAGSSVSGLNGALFRVRAQNGSGPVTSSAAVLSGSVGPTPPLPPSNFRIIAMTGNNVTLAWTLPSSGPAPTALQLEGGLTPGSVLGAVPLGVTPAITIALPGGSFFLRLRTAANGVLSGPSNEILAHIDLPVTPSAPANLLGLVVGDALALAWTPTVVGGAPTGAILDVSGAVAASLPLGNVDRFQFAGVPPGTYTFAVRQSNAGGASGQSNSVTLTFPGPCSGAPQPPANFVAYKAAGVLSLMWDPPSSGPAPTAYHLNVTGSFVGTLPMAGRALSVPGPPGTFHLSITASNACGSSAASPVQTVSFP